MCWHTSVIPPSTAWASSCHGISVGIQTLPDQHLPPSAWTSSVTLNDRSRQLWSDAYRVSTTASRSATSLASDGDMVISHSFAEPAACEMQPVPASAPLKAPIIVFSNGYSRSASMRSIRPAALAWIRRDPISWPKVPVNSTRTSATCLCGCSSDNNLLAVL